MSKLGVSDILSTGGDPIQPFVNFKSVNIKSKNKKILFTINYTSPVCPLGALS